MKKGDLVTEIIFKHSRFNFIQSVYGGLSEDGSLEAVEKTEERLDRVFQIISEASKEDDKFTDCKAIEICFNEAKTMEELLIFIYKVSAESSCPTHPFLQMLQGRINPPNPNEGEN
jgi:GTP cyclohydrolase I|tara:strand:- start:7726 stop:8073 length:348 start_codon:yes stop_codon:yes gene_type:complete